MQMQMALVSSTVMALFVALIVIPGMTYLLLGKLVLLSQLDYLHYILGVALTLALLSLQQGDLATEEESEAMDRDTLRPRAIPKSARARRDALAGERQARERMGRALTALEGSIKWEPLKQDGGDFSAYWSRGHVKFEQRLPLAAVAITSILDNDDFAWAENLIKAQSASTHHLILTAKEQFALPALQLTLRKRRYELEDGRSVFFYTGPDIDWALLVVRPLEEGQILLQGALAGSFKVPVPSLIKASLLTEHLPQALSKLARYALLQEPLADDDLCLDVIRKRLDALEEKLTIADVAPRTMWMPSVVMSAASLVSYYLFLQRRSRAPTHH